MGAVGFVLPGVILAMTIATINKGFGASGAKLQKDHAGDNFGEGRETHTHTYTMGLMGPHTLIHTREGLMGIPPS